MRKAIIFIVLVLLGSAAAGAQEKSVISVKDNFVSSGTLVLEVTVADKPARLQCNEGSMACAVLKAGKYQMVKLPKNYGLYDCQNVDVFAETANPESDQRLGEYCLVQK